MKPRSFHDEDGFSVVEMMVALAIFSVVATIFAAQLVSNYRNYALTTDRAVAEDIATEAIETGRRLDYASLGTSPGNPPGVIPRDTTKTVDGVVYDITTNVQYVDDPVPGGYRTAANYKRLEVNVGRNGQIVASLSTIVAPPVKAATNRATIKVLAADYGNNTAIANAQITVAGGPSPSRTDFTDGGGHTVFPDLLPTDASNPNYVITAAATGYSVLPDDVAPAPAAQTSLLVTQVYSTTIRMFKTVTVTANLVKPDGTPFLYPSTLSISSARGSSSLPVSNGTIAFTSAGTEPVIPSVSYTLSATATIAGVAVTGTAVTKTVPDLYPSDLTSDFTIVMPLAPTPVTVTVLTPSNSPAAGVPVVITGGDDNVTHSVITASDGKVSISLPPSVVVYNVSLPTQNQSTTLSVAGTPVAVSFTLLAPAVNFVFRDATGAPVVGASFAIGGGDDNVVYNGVSNAAGELAMNLTQSTSPYTLDVTSAPASSLRFLVSGPSNYLVFMTSAIKVRVKASNGPNLSDINVLIAGGDLNASLSGVTANNGKLEINVAPAAAPYTLTIPAQAGYQAFTQTIVVDGTSQTFNVDLVPI